MSWQELNADQVRRVAAITHGGLTREEMLTALFCELCGVQLKAYHSKLKGRYDFAITYEGIDAPIGTYELRVFANRFSWAIDTKPFDIACPFNINRHLMGTTFGNYFHADTMLLRYALNGEQEWVLKALEDLGDPRDELSDDDAPALELWWSGFKRWLKAQYQEVFDEKSIVDEKYSPVKTRQDIMLMLTDGHPQDNEQIEQSNLHDVLSALQYKIEQTKQARAQLKKT